MLDLITTFSAQLINLFLIYQTDNYQQDSLSAQIIICTSKTCRIPIERQPEQYQKGCNQFLNLTLNTIPSPIFLPFQPILHSRQPYN